MNAKVIQLPDRKEDLTVTKSPYENIEPAILLLIFLILWFFGSEWIFNLDESVGNINRSIWLLILISLISFLLILALCWWLLQRFWTAAGLPEIKQMVLQFNTLSLWKQLGFYWASFALILLSAMVCLSAIC